MDQERARHLMRANNLDALLLGSPENFFYGTGCSSMIFDLYRQAPLAMALYPADASLEPAIIVPSMDAAAARRTSGVEEVHSITLWWDIYDLVGIPEKEGGLESWLKEPPSDVPEQYDRPAICELVGELLKERHLSRGRIGLELDFVDVNTFKLLQAAVPDVEFVDSTALMYDLRVLKNAAEIEHLRHAVELAEAGMVASTEVIAEGTTVGMITEALQRGVWKAAEERGLREQLGRMSGQPTLTSPGQPPGSRCVTGPGTTFKFDVQVCVSHYHSDIGRSYVLGEPTRAQRRVYETLQGAHARLRETLRPGTAFNDVFHATAEELNKAGLGRHNRGHYGHSVGLDVKVEEPPFISATETRPLEPGMVLAIETPFYAWGLGVFQIEDYALITPDGCEIWNQEPYDLKRLD